MQDTIILERVEDQEYSFELRKTGGSRSEVCFA